jgi:hypothetical protein
MTVLVILLVVVICSLTAYLLGRVNTPERPSRESLPDPEHLQRAAVELYRIRRQRESSELHHQQRQEVTRLKREIAEALEQCHE